MDRRINYRSFYQFNPKNRKNTYQLIMRNSSISKSRQNAPFFNLSKRGAKGNFPKSADFSVQLQEAEK